MVIYSHSNHHQLISYQNPHTGRHWLKGVLMGRLRLQVLVVHAQLVLECKGVFLFAAFCLWHDMLCMHDSLSIQMLWYKPCITSPDVYMILYFLLSLFVHKEAWWLCFKLVWIMDKFTCLYFVPTLTSCVGSKINVGPWYLIRRIHQLRRHSLCFWKIKSLDCMDIRKRYIIWAPPIIISR